MRASVRIVLGVCAALLVAVVWFGRDRLEPVESEAHVARSVVHATSAQASSLSSTQPAQIVRHADGEHEEHMSSEAEEQGTMTSVPAQGADTPLITTSTATAHKVLMPQPAPSPEQDAEASEEPDLSELQKLNRISCDFTDGFNNGSVWEGKLQQGSASWQGGPIVYEMIDPENGTAQMIGNAGATGSLEGRADARVMSRPDRVEFLSDLKNGQLVLTTVYGQLHERGGYIAVMSRHEGRNGPFSSYGSQFIGSCR
jgi:hypothetical protein